MLSLRHSRVEHEAYVVMDAAIARKGVAVLDLTSVVFRKRETIPFMKG